MTMSADTASDLNLFSLEFVRLRHITSRQSVHKDDSQLLPACLTWAAGEISWQKVKGPEKQQWGDGLIFLVSQKYFPVVFNEMRINPKSVSLAKIKQQDNFSGHVSPH